MQNFDSLLSRKLTGYQAIQQPHAQRLRASVSLIFRLADSGAELLLIQRAFNEKDPWSGQVAFPGGKFEPADLNSRTTAERETVEEVGIQLLPQDYIGRLDDVLGPSSSEIKSVHLSCFVYCLRQIVETQHNYEVARVLWVPVSRLNDARNIELFQHPQVPGKMMRGISLEANSPLLLWGLSLKVLWSLFERLQISADNDYRIFY